MVTSTPTGSDPSAPHELTDGNETKIADGCPLDLVLKIISGEWTTHILWTLGRNGPTRHGQLRRLVEGISTKVLTQRLRSLEEAGIVYRDHKPTVPPEVTYGLTARGLELDAALRSLEPLAERWG